MVAIPTSQCSTLVEADRVIEERQKTEKPRPYLGMSGLGEECERKLWYRFRWLARELFSAQALKNFEDGHRTEELVVERIRRIPEFEAYAVDPETGKQFEVLDFGGHLSGHLDGAVLGVRAAPKTWHVLEVKASGKMKDLAKAVAKLGEKNALRDWNFTYYVQALLYMHYTGMTRHWLVCTTPGGREWTSVRTEPDEIEVMRQKARAQRVIFNQYPLPRLSDNPEFYKCRWCSFQGACHRGELPTDKNCRTCLHATPREAGGWHCARFDKELSVADQRAGCPSHLFIPDLIPGEIVEANAEGEWIKYRLQNGESHVDSARPVQ